LTGKENDCDDDDVNGDNNSIRTTNNPATASTGAFGPETVFTTMAAAAAARFDTARQHFDDNFPSFFCVFPGGFGIK
jgi:hypothetical protein